MRNLLHLQMAAFPFSPQENTSIGLLCLILLVFLGRRVHSVYFGPLAKFPGPKLAAATLWYEFYFDVILKGRYTFKIKELHEKYGMRWPACPSCRSRAKVFRSHHQNQST
jgi:hypothetical protein